MTISEAEYPNYLERLVHTAFNPRCYSREKEGEWLLKLAALKLGLSVEDCIK